MVINIMQGIYDGMTLDEIKKMDPEEHKVIEEHPFNYRYPRGEVRGIILYLKWITEETITRKFFMEIKFRIFMANTMYVD